LALLEERERIGMELHDGVIQSLYAIGMQIELLRTSESVAPQELKHATTQIDSVIEDIREYIQDLQRQNISRRRCAIGLQDTIARLHIPETLSVNVSAPDYPILLSPSTYEAIYQMTNEALSNVVRHADATQVELTARHLGNQVTNSRLRQWSRI